MVNVQVPTPARARMISAIVWVVVYIFSPRKTNPNKKRTGRRINQLGSN
jgi:hypothetical protein